MASEVVSNGPDVSQTNSFDESSSEVESVSSHYTYRMCQDLVSLFLNKNYYEILTLIPSLSKNMDLHVSGRIILSLTLFKLGRIEAAIRELSVTIELNNDFEERERLINYLVQVLGEIGMHKEAVICIHELISLTRLNILIHSNDEVKLEELKKKCKMYQTDLEAHEALKDTVAMCCILTQSLIGDALLALQDWKADPAKRTDLDPLHKIYTALKYFGPLYVFNPLIDHGILVKEFVENQISVYPEINYCITPKNLAKQLQRWNNMSSSRALMSLCGLIIKHQVISGFLSFVQQDYATALQTFNWVLGFFNLLDKRFKFFSNKNEYLSSITRRVTSLLVCRCYMLGSIECNEVDLGRLLTSLVSIDELNITTEYLSGRLGVYFIACGYLYEKMACASASKIDIEDQSQVPIALCLRYSKTYVGEMLRKYVLASTLQAHDDPTTIACYDRIIWGLLLYGGVHLKTFWMFVHLRHYFAVENDYGPLSVCNEHKHKWFSNNDILDQYQNGWEVVDKIYFLWNHLSEQEKENVWDPDLGKFFLMPQIFAQNDKLILVDKFYNEYSSYNAKCFLFVSDYQVKHKLKGHIKLSNKIIQEHLDFSRDLIFLWCESFNRYHGEVPNFISTGLDEIV